MKKTPHFKSCDNCKSSSHHLHLEVVNVSPPPCLPHHQQAPTASFYGVWLFGLQFWTQSTFTRWRKVAKPNMVTLLNRNLRNKRAPQRKYFRLKNLTNILRKGVKKNSEKAVRLTAWVFQFFFTPSLTIIPQQRRILEMLAHCETQRFPDQKLSSPVFTCCPVPSRIGDISTYLHYMMF